MQPLVTVVTPSFNYARFIGDCLSSVRAQTWPRIEHLVLDAGSTDGSLDAIRPFLGTYPVQVTLERDSGQADGLNRGFARARGDVLCWLNADDYWLHERVVAEAVAALEGGADVVTAGGWYVDAERRRRSRIQLSTPGRAVADLPYADTFLQPATFWRSRLHRPLRTDLQYAFDWQLWLSFRRAGARFAVLDHEWAAYRLHAVSKTHEDPARRKLEIAQVLAEQFGRASPQWLWAIAVAGGYGLSELARLPGLKERVRRANGRIRELTRGKVYSC